MKSENLVRYAGFWNRFLAFIIDHIILGFIKIIFLIPFSSMFSLDFYDPFNDKKIYYTSSIAQDYQDPSVIFAVIFFYFLFILLLNAIFGWLYYTIFETSNKMATPGKMVLGIKVIDIYGNKLSFGKATGRYLGKYLSSLIVFVGYLMAAFTERKQALHDILANCLVVYEHQLSEIETTEITTVELNSDWSNYTI